MLWKITPHVNFMQYSTTWVFKSTPKHDCHYTHIIITDYCAWKVCDDQAKGDGIRINPQYMVTRSGRLKPVTNLGITLVIDHREWRVNSNSIYMYTSEFFFSWLKLYVFLHPVFFKSLQTENLCVTKLVFNNVGIKID